MRKVLVSVLLVISIISLCLALLSNRNAYVSDNIEALSNNESGGIHLELCFSSGSWCGSNLKYVCADGTSLFYGTPEVTGTFYPCAGQIEGGILTKIGYCYVSD